MAAIEQNALFCKLLQAQREGVVENLIPQTAFDKNGDTLSLSLSLVTRLNTKNPLIPPRRRHPPPRTTQKETSFPLTTKRKSRAVGDSRLGSRDF